MDEELKKLLDEARQMGASIEQLDGIVSAYNLKKKGQSSDVSKNGTTPTSPSKSASASKSALGTLIDPALALTNDNGEINVNGVAVPIRNVSIPFSDNKKAYHTGLQQRINAKTFTPEDVTIVAGAMKVSPLSASAFMSNKPQTAEAIHFNDIKTKYNDVLQQSVLRANQELGRNDDYEEILSSTAKTTAYISEIENQYKQKTDEQVNSLNKSEAGRDRQYKASLPFLPLGTITPSSVKEAHNKIATANSQVLSGLKSLLVNDIYDKVAVDPNLSAEEKIKVIAGVDRSYANSQRAIADRLNPVSYVTNYAMEKFFPWVKSTKEKIEILNSDKAHIEKGINAKIAERIAFNNALIGSINEDMEEKLKATDIPDGEKNGFSQKIQTLQAENSRLIPDYQDEEALIKKYPILFKEKIISKLNEYNAITGGNVEGQEDINVSRDEFLRNNGIDPNNQVVKDATSVFNNELKDYSLFGKPLTAIANVFSSAAKSTGDLISTGGLIPLRDEADVLSEKKSSELFPTSVGEKDEFQLKKPAKFSQNMANLTGQVIGQGLLQAGTLGIGRLAGLTKVAAANTAFWSSGALTSYDSALKDSYDFIDNDAGRVAYAGLIALSNAASEKIFPDVKLIQIPGVREQIARLASKVGTKEFTKEFTTEALGKASNALVDYSGKYAKNISKETIEEVSTDLFESSNRLLFGDPNISIEKAIESAKNTAIQTALGMPLIAGMGARADMKTERNMSAKSTIYNSAVYYDEAMDAINLGFKEKIYSENERDLKIKLLNTARSATKVMNDTEASMSVDLTRPQRELYVANLTAESVLKEQNKSIDDPVVKETNDDKIKALQEQRKGILSNEVRIDDNGNFTTPPTIEKNEVPIKDATQTKSTEATKTESPITTQTENTTTTPVAPNITEEEAASIVNTIVPNDELPKMTLDVMKGNPMEALKTIADQALGVTRINDVRTPIAGETQGVGQYDQAVAAYGQETVDKATAAFPLELSTVSESAEQPVQKTRFGRTKSSVQQATPAEIITEETVPETQAELKVVPTREENLRSTRENLPEVDNLSNVDVIKIADKRAKELLAERNPQQEIVESDAEVIKLTDQRDELIKQRDNLPTKTVDRYNEDGFIVGKYEKPLEGESKEKFIAEKNEKINELNEQIAKIKVDEIEAKRSEGISDAGKIKINDLTYISNEKVMDIKLGKKEIVKPVGKKMKGRMREVTVRTEQAKIYNKMQALKRLVNCK